MWESENGSVTEPKPYNTPYKDTLFRDATEWSNGAVSFIYVITTRLNDC